MSRRLWLRVFGAALPKGLGVSTRGPLRAAVQLKGRDRLNFLDGATAE
jgi:hypothetical protein